MDTLVEAPVKTGTGSKTITLPHAFTRENAAEMTRRGAIAKAAKRKARREAGLEALTSTDNTYVNQRLTRVRAQLAKLDAMIDAELDPQKLDRLVCAQNRLSEQWRIFSGIPLPGSRRPGRESTSKAPSSFEPSE